MKNILFVNEDERSFDEVERFFTNKGYQITTLDDLHQVIPTIELSVIDAVIVQGSLDNEDIPVLCRQIKQWSNAPLILCGEEDNEDAEITALELGVDDYQSSTESLRILEARVAARLRRQAILLQGDTGNSGSFAVGTLKIVPTQRTVFFDGEQLELTTAEYEMLVLLARRAGEVISRDELYQELRGINYDGLDRSIDLRASRIRKKLSDVSNGAVNLLKSVRGVGYMIVRFEEDI